MSHNAASVAFWRTEQGENEHLMAALLTTTGPLDISVYDQMSPGLPRTSRAAPGFRSHAARGGSNRSERAEVWDSAEDHRAFLEADVKPNLPEGATVGVVEFSNVITRSRGHRDH